MSFHIGRALAPLTQIAAFEGVKLVIWRCDVWFWCTFRTCSVARLRSGMYAKADRAADHSEFLGSRELTDPCSANPFEMIHGLLPLTKTNIDRLEKQKPS